MMTSSLGWEWTGSSREVDDAALLERAVARFAEGDTSCRRFGALVRLPDAVVR